MLLGVYLWWLILIITVTGLRQTSEIDKTYFWMSLAVTWALTSRTIIGPWLLLFGFCCSLLSSAVWCHELSTFPQSFPLPWCFALEPVNDILKPLNHEPKWTFSHLNMSAIYFVPKMETRPIQHERNMYSVYFHEFLFWSLKEFYAMITTVALILQVNKLLRRTCPDLLVYKRWVCINIKSH